MLALDCMKSMSDSVLVSATFYLCKSTQQRGDDLKFEVAIRSTSNADSSGTRSFHFSRK